MRLASANLTAIRTFDLPGDFPIAISSGTDSAGSSKFGALLLEQIPSKSGQAPPSEERPETTIALATAAPARGVDSLKVASPNHGKAPLAAEPRSAEAPQGPPRPTALPQTAGLIQLRSDTPAVLIGASAPRSAPGPAMGKEAPNSPSDSGVPSVEENPTGLDPTSAEASGPKATIESDFSNLGAANQSTEASSPVQRGEQAKPAEGTSALKSRKSESTRSADAAAAYAASDLIRVVSSGDSAPSAVIETPAAGGLTLDPASSGATVRSGEKPAAGGEGLSFPASGKRGASWLRPPSLPAGPPSAPGIMPDPARTVAGVAAAPHTAIHDSQGGLTTPAQPRRSEQPLVEGDPATGAHRAHAEPVVAQAPISSGITPSIPGHSAAASFDRGGPPVAAFERMDAVEPPRVLETTPQKLTVGVRDSGLGWIEIRTHAVTGQVAATLASSTHEAHAAIAAELPAIRDTLMNQHIALQSLSAERFSSSTGGGGSASDRSDSADPAHTSFLKSKADPPFASNEAEGEELSYISVRV